MSKGAVIYIRVSTDEQATETSLQAQEAKCQNFCRDNVLSVVETFTDAGQSARSTDRPQLQALLTFCKTNRAKVSAVVVADLSRLARNIADQGNLIANLAQWGIQLVSVDEKHLDQTAAGKLAKNILGSFAQFFSDSLSEKTAYRMKEAVKSGRFVWVAPLGYLNPKSGSGAVIKLDAERAPLVRKGFELMATGRYSADDVLRQINALGLTTRKGAPVPRQTWHSMLRNPLYAGWVKSGDLLVRGLHQPIVTQKIFDSVQDALKDNGKQKTRHSENEFPLRQFCRCIGCGKGLTGAVIRKKNGKEFAYYWCYTKDCRAIAVSKDELERQFLRLLATYKPTVELLEMLPEIARRKWAVREQQAKQELRALKAKQEEIRRLNQQAIRAKLKGELSAEDFDLLKAGNAEELARIDEQIKAFDSEASTMEHLIEQTERELVDFVGAWRKGGLNEKRQIQEAFFPDGLAWSHENGFLNHQNERLMKQWAEFFQSLAAYSGETEFVSVNFGVPLTS